MKYGYSKMIFLKIAIIYVLVLFQYVNAALIRETSSSPWVVVVGSGPSGIAAATRLYENGITNITILEAQNRIGGRVFTTQFADTVVDIGAQWCHGEEGNVVFNMVKDLDLLSDSVLHNYQFIDTSGSIVDQTITERFREIIENITSNYGDELPNYNKSYGDFCAEKFYQIANQDEIFKEINPTLKKQCLELFEKYENTGDAADTWFDTSAKMEFKICPGNQELNWKNRGYTTIIDILLKKFPDSSKALNIDDKFLLNKEVINILWGNNGKIKVTTLDNSVYEPDYVITTTSLGVLKERYETLFTPALPERKVNAIQSLGYGTVDKIYLHYDQPWWPENWHGVSILWTDEDKESYQGERAWLKGLTGFYRVDYKPKLLSGWITGPFAREMEKLSHEEVERQCTDLLRRVLVNKSFNVTKPTAVHRTAWFSNPYFRGSYSYRSVGADRIGAYRTDLSEPLTTTDNLQGLLFAGEATVKDHHSTVHGAIESGWREADRIINFRT